MCPSSKNYKILLLDSSGGDAKLCIKWESNKWEKDKRPDRIKEKDHLFYSKFEIFRIYIFIVFSSLQIAYHF
jgi:hypothetical protein